MKHALFVGRLETRQELLVDIAAGIGIALEFLELDRRLDVGEHLALERRQLPLQRFLLVLRGLVIGFGAFDVPLALRLDLAIQLAELIVGYDQVRMTIAEHRALLRDLVVELRALRTQDTQQVGSRAGWSLDIGLQVALGLFVTAPGFLAEQPGGGYLLVEFGDAKLARRAFLARVDDLVLGLERGDGIVGGADLVIQGLEPAVQPAGGLLDRCGPGLGLACDERFGQRIAVVGGPLRICG